MSDNEAGRIQVDADWKTEAALEKERLEKETSASAAPAGGVPGKPGFADLVNLLAMQAAIALGGYKGPGGESIPPHPEAAKHHIDLLDVMEEKTKGNLTADEKRVLDSVLYELRMQYVQVLNSASPAPSGPAS